MLIFSLSITIDVYKREKVYVHSLKKKERNFLLSENFNQIKPIYL